MAAAVSDYIAMFTGLYAAPTERSGRGVPRVVEELTAFHGTLPLTPACLPRATLVLPSVAGKQGRRWRPSGLWFILSSIDSFLSFIRISTPLPSSLLTS